MIEFIFTVLLSIPVELDARFNVVYDTDHLLNMVRIPGVRSCTRYKLDWSDNPDMLSYLALYSLDDPDLPRSDGWKQHAAMGAWPREIRPHVTARRNGSYHRLFYAGSKDPADSFDSDVIYYLMQSIAPGREAQFNELYSSDHLPLMLKAPGVQSCTRYKLLHSDAGELPDYLAIYAIDSAEIPRSAEWKKQTSLGAWPTVIRPYFTARQNGVFHRTGVFSAKQSLG